MSKELLQRISEETLLMSLTAFIAGFAISYAKYSVLLTIAGKIIVTAISLTLMIIFYVVARKFQIDITKVAKNIK